MTDGDTNPAVRPAGIRDRRPTAALRRRLLFHGSADVDDMVGDDAEARLRGSFPTQPYCQKFVGVLHPLFAKIAHFFGDQAAAEAKPYPPHRNHAANRYEEGCL